ncbi:hypothetical protein [Gelidibacter maritimus]|uniref:Uncharacterized protein n=1 Tax=Gelidibacter maritimus TaxID=2761487 RepID=A0A7W2M2W6_9FLAO|nr:hypothetical protein [Gelidibacter maritimus]MBA6151688.1 hypothetical protein [Gelidibacter maritimus]
MKYLKTIFGKISLIALVLTTLTLLMLTLTSCSLNDNDYTAQIMPPTAQQFAGIRAQSLENITQHFEFNADDGYISLTTNNGVEVSIYANCLSKDGNPVTGAVALEYVEIFEKGNMITTNKPTMGRMSNGDKAMLVTGGEFYFEATQDGIALEINCPMIIKVPTSLTGGDDPEMIMWQGSIDDNGDLTWEEEGDVAGEAGLFIQGGNYLAFVQNFGWTNIDRFYSDPRPKTTIKIQPPLGYTYENSAVYLSYDGEDSGLALLDTFDNGLFSEHYGQIPIGLDCHIIFVTEDNGVWRYATKAVTIAENQVTAFSIEESTVATEAELISIVNNLP